MVRLRWMPAFFCCFVCFAFAQNSTLPSGTPTQPTLIPRSHEAREQRYRALHHMILNVVVTDASGHPASGLKPEDFTLFDNQKQQELASFRAVNGAEGAAPTNVVLVLDTVNSTPRSLAFEIKEIQKYLRQSEGNLSNPTSLAVLTGSGIRFSQATIDGEALWQQSKELVKDIQTYTCTAKEVNAVASLPLVGHGGTGAGGWIEKVNDGACLSERFTLSLNGLSALVAAKKDLPGRAIFIWIGPGWPKLWGAEFQADSPAIRHNHFRHLVELSNSLREAQVTLDAVSSPDLFHTAELTSVRKDISEGVRTESRIAASSLALETLARHSGGQVMTTGKDIAGYIAASVVDATVYYALSFDFAPAPEPDEFHALQVTVNSPGVKVRTNREYYAEP